MKFQSLLSVIVVLGFIAVPAIGVAEELVENMPIKSIHEEEAKPAIDTQVDIQTSHVMRKRIPLGHALVLAFPQPFTRAVVANPSIADSLVLSPTQLYLSGKAIGYTTLTLWNREKNLSGVLELIVHLPIGALQQNIEALFPEEKDIVITSAHEHIVLTGQVSSIDMKDKVGQVAGAYAPGKVLNFLKYVHE